MNNDKDIEIKKAIRYAFLNDWVEQATHEEIVDKLIQNDDRAKQLEDIKSYIKNSDLDKMLWGKELLKIIDKETRT